MTQGKLILLWAVAMIGLGGLYFYSKVSGPCDCPSCRMAADNPNAVIEPSLALGTSLPPLTGRWLPSEKDGQNPVFKDKVVLLDFWGTFCSPCIAAIPANNTIAEKYAAQGLVLAGVSQDPKAALLDFKKTHDVRYPLLASDEKTFVTYEIAFTPSTFLFDRHGKLIWKGGRLDNAKDGSINPAFEKALTQALAETPAATNPATSPAATH